VDWVLATKEPGGRAESWVHDETGLVVESTIADMIGHGGSEYSLTLSRIGGGRCSAALAFLALADFGMLSAREDEMPGRPERVFRRPVPEAPAVRGN
jgi:hypothetical protein